MWIIGIIAAAIYALAIVVLWRRGNKRDRVAAQRERSRDEQIDALRRDVELLATREGIGGPAPTLRTPAVTGPPPSQSGVRSRATIGAPAEEETQVMQRGAAGR